MFSKGFTGTVFEGESIECEVDGFTATATIFRDDDGTPPWERGNWHGPVSKWCATSSKRPGELILSTNGWNNAQARFYDFAEACRIARRDGWGVRPYDVETERGAYGFVRLSGQWFHGRELITFRTDWHDDINAARGQLHEMHRASVSPRKYASLAALQDYERIRQWCSDQWEYVGVSVTVEKAGVEVVGDYEHALWGIESDSPEYLTEVANQLLPEALDSARAKIAEIAA